MSDVHGARGPAGVRGGFGLMVHSVFAGTICAVNTVVPYGSAAASPVAANKEDTIKGCT